MEYGALGTPRPTNLHLHPQATTFLSPPGGIYLISPGGRFLSMFSYETENRLKLNQTNKRDAARRPPPAGRRPPTADRRRPTEVLPASSYTPRVSIARFAHGLPTPGRAAHGLLNEWVAGSIGESK